MPAADPPRSRAAELPALLALFSGLLVAFVPMAGAQSSGEALRAEIERQQDLLNRIQRSSSADEVAEAGGSVRSGSRVSESRAAPFAPQLRDLPVAIFDESKVSIPVGQWNNAQRLTMLRRSLDADGDGTPELLRFIDPQSGLLVRQVADRNYDGVFDSWEEYEWGELVRRIVDANDDGKADGWESYEKGRMSLREVDRDDDGIRDGFYRYEGDSLMIEEHDANNDGQIDRVVKYRNRYRTRAEEDVDRDGRMDVWYRYEVIDGEEIVTHVERDKAGRGKADIFETFEAMGNSAVLARRAEDVDGDGKIDIVSIYRDGKLVRRELSAPDLRPL
jgi:hypothetical protein